MITYYNKDKCQATVYKRDQYRLERGRGFKMHYTEDQCNRNKKYGNYCWQHKYLDGDSK